MAKVRQKLVIEVGVGARDREPDPVAYFRFGRLLTCVGFEAYGTIVTCTTWEQVQGAVREHALKIGREAVDREIEKRGHTAELLHVATMLKDHMDEISHRVRRGETIHVVVEGGVRLGSYVPDPEEPLGFRWVELPRGWRLG